MFSFNTQHFIKHIYTVRHACFFTLLSLSLSPFAFINYKFPDTTLIKLNWTSQLIIMLLSFLSLSLGYKYN